MYKMVQNGIGPKWTSGQNRTGTKLSKKEKTMNKEIDEQKEFMKQVAMENEGKNQKYSILTMGCQLNENDSEKISGMLEEMGYTRTEKIEESNLVVINTCCVRENAEERLFGKVGELKNLKEKNDMIIAIGGCMMQEKQSII